MRRVAGIFAVLIFLACTAAAPACVAADTNAVTLTGWLDAAADPQRTLRVRNYAAAQILMLADQSASILIAALSDPASGLRRQVAARLLGEIAAPDAEAALLAAAFDEDYFLAQAAGDALARLYSRLPDATLRDLFLRGGRAGGTVPGGSGAGADDWLVLSLQQSQTREKFRSFVMRGLEAKYTGAGNGIPPGLLDCVWEGLASSDPALRLAAVRAAAASRSDLAPERLAAFLFTETEPGLLAAALRALAAMRPSAHHEAAERHAAHADPIVSLEALAALDAMGRPEALFPAAAGARSVAGYVTHPSTPVRRRAIQLLGASKTPAALDYLLPALRDRVGMNRAAAARALRELGFAAAVGGLTPMLADGWPQARAAAALALHEMGVVGVPGRVIEDLAPDAALPFRRVAAATLGELGDRAATPALITTLRDADLELVCLAAEALGRLGDRRAGPALYAAMAGDREAALVDAAREALTDIYRDDPGTAAGWPEWARRNGVAIGE